VLEQATFLATILFSYFRGRSRLYGIYVYQQLTAKLVEFQVGSLS